MFLKVLAKLLHYPLETDLDALPTLVYKLMLRATPKHQVRRAGGPWTAGANTRTVAYCGLTVCVLVRTVARRSFCCAVFWPTSHV